MNLRIEDNENSPIDLPPEYCHFPDDGCDFSGTCLNCHLPLCVYDEPGGKKLFPLHQRTLDIARLFRNENSSVRELATRFGVSIRTIQRALRAVLGDRKGKGVKKNG
ncbi:MAG: hypothetical protein Q8O43_04015 [Dehalococcoidia bacterium]|nr:hypothetical protein [Dehalococcoidia bacterium]